MGKKRNFVEKAPVNKGKIALGAVGALLFAVPVVAAYFWAGQLKIELDIAVLAVACVCGLIIALVSNLGYGLLSGEKGKRSYIRLICVSAVTLTAVLAAVHSCEFYELYQAFLKQGLNFGEAWKAYPQWTAIKDIADEISKEVWAALALPAVAALREFSKIRAEQKKYR